MEKTITLEEALKRIEELEKENAELREKLEYYRNRKLSGRQKHNAKWMAIYNDFVVGYESGMTMVEIAKRNNVSERTIYRYKAYYDKLREKRGIDHFTGVSKMVQCGRRKFNMEKKMINRNNRTIITNRTYC